MTEHEAALNPDDCMSMSNVVSVKDDLEDALCLVVQLIEMSSERESEEWGQEVWDENARMNLRSLRKIIDRLPGRV